MVIKRVIREIAHRTNFNPSKVLDFGAGIGSGSWALWDLFNKKNIIAVEPNSNMRKLGKFLTMPLDTEWYEDLISSPGLG